MQLVFTDYIQNRILKKNKQKKIKLLNKKNILVYPNFKGFQLGFLVFFCFACSIFYQINFGLLLSIIMFFIFFLSIILSFQNLNKLQLSARTQLVESSKKTVVKIELKNHTKNNKININLKNNNLDEINIENIENYKKIDLPIFFKDRGTFKLPSINIYSVFPFGIIKSSSFWESDKEIYVYPKPIKPNYNVLVDHNLNSNDINNYEFDNIDDYKIGENKSRIAWKQSLTKNKLLSKKFTSEDKASSVIIDLEKISADTFEKKLSYASYLILNLYLKKIPFSLRHKKFSQTFSTELNHKNKALIYLSNVKN